ncbi:hypothetical protein [Rhodopila sp.]|jgi:hypothetical protein|uniref:hypothetical protein n=1 Tax=Rhodopila sp. TaxID=2480087 RepID=UPI002C7FF31A|nr:hypothetical protein [Rhodopila sp.]HVZ10280.1 hypothetical protein [Rhodopila sp.]
MVQTERHDIYEYGKRLWIEEGAPPGKLEEFIERARELQAIKDNPTAGQLPNPMQGDRPVIEEAALQDNLGEFPSRLTDQGDRPQTPSARPRQRDSQE